MSGGGVLALFAHPDDEALVAGGTLAACAAAGLEVVLVSLTRGEQGPISSPEVATRQTLAVIREQELRASGRALGIGRVECWSYPDGELRWADAHEVQASLRTLLRTWKPAAVITFGPEGLYWHADHIAVHRFAAAAVGQTAQEGLAPALYYATWPEGWAAELVAELAGRGLAGDLWGLDPGAFGVPPASITTTLDVRSFLPRKLRALHEHRSQLGPDHLFRVLPEDLAERFLGWEHLVLARGAAGNVDWLTKALTPAGVLH